MVDTYDGQPELDSLRKMASLYGIDFDELTTQISDRDWETCTWILIGWYAIDII